MRHSRRRASGRPLNLVVRPWEIDRMAEKLSEAWDDFCHRGSYSVTNQRRSVARCLGVDGIVRGWYSDLPLDPTIPVTRSMYPSHDHTTHPKNDQHMVVDARVVNDMKSHLDESEFWLLVEHLYAVGLAKGKIPQGAPQRLADNWSSIRHFGGDE